MQGKLESFTINDFTLLIYSDKFYNANSKDNTNSYKFDYRITTKYQYSTAYGIKIFKNDKLIESAIIASDGGSTGLYENSIIIESNRFLITCGDYIYCIEIPSLRLIWKTQADDFTCFDIFSFQKDYFVRGELNISRLNYNGEILWQTGGKEIFVNIEGKKEFTLKENHIEAIDFDSNIYKIDFNGKFIL